jgi:hypothetical protein
LFQQSPTALQTDTHNPADLARIPDTAKVKKVKMTLMDRMVFLVILVIIVSVNPYEKGLLSS